MQKQIIIWFLTFSLITIMTASTWAQQWSIKADLAEGCNCSPACPCNFGSSPTHGYCEANGLIEIKQGHYGDVQLDGISLVYAGRLGEWIKYYISKNATDEQVEVLPLLISELFELPSEMKILSTEKVSVFTERTENKVKFSVPTSTVEIEMMKGMDGKPIKIQNLLAPYSIGYTQYKTIINNHNSKDKEFSYSGTHGSTSKIDAKSK